MKFLKKFATEAEKSGFTFSNDVVSYVEETDKVYTNSLYKLMSYIWINDSEESYRVGLYCCERDSLQVSGASTIDYITIDGQPIDMDALRIDSPNNSDFKHATYSPQPRKTQDGHIILLGPDHVDADSDHMVEVWLDEINGVVKKVSDNRQLNLIVDVDIPLDPPIPSGSYLVYYDVSNEEIYIMVNDQKVDITQAFGSDVPPFDPGNHTIELYTLDKNAIFKTFGTCYFPESISHYTLSKNVKEIKDYSFSGKHNSHLSEIWYEGTMDEFNAIEKGTKWNEWAYGNKSIQTVHCSDGDLSV